MKSESDTDSDDDLSTNDDSTGQTEQEDPDPEVYEDHILPKQIGRVHLLCVRSHGPAVGS